MKLELSQASTTLRNSNFTTTIVHQYAPSMAHMMGLLKIASKAWWAKVASVVNRRVFGGRFVFVE